MLHITICPKCENTVHTFCDNVPNPFQRIHSEHIARILNPQEKFPPIEPMPASCIGHLKLMFLLHMLDGELPEIDELPEIAPQVSDYIDDADESQVRHMLIQLMGRWDVLEGLSATD